MLNIFLVGGAVRDKILQLNVKEFDWVIVNSDIKNFLKIGFKQVGKDFPVFLHPFSKEEYTLARKEKKAGKGYYNFSCDFSFYVSLREDLFRRDLTINTLSLNKNGLLLDLFNGVEDLKNKKISHVSFAFFDDSLRVLRIFRFFIKYSYFNFKISNYTESFIKKIIFDGEMLNFTFERIFKEIFLSLNYKDAFLFFSLANKFKFLKYIFYDLNLLFSFSQKYDFNIYFDFTLQIGNLFLNVYYYTNNVLFKFILLFLKISFYNIVYFSFDCLFFYNKRNLIFVNRYIKYFNLAKKYKFFLVNLFRFRWFFVNVFFINDYFLFLFFFKLNIFKDKLKFIYYLLINDLDSKVNDKNYIFFNKYLFLDLAELIYFFKFYNSYSFNISYNFYNKVFKINFYRIKFYYNKYF